MIHDMVPLLIRLKGEGLVRVLEIKIRRREISFRPPSAQFPVPTVQDVINYFGNDPPKRPREGAIGQAMKRTCPLGERKCVQQMAERHDRFSTLRPRGR